MVDYSQELTVDPTGRPQLPPRCHARGRRIYVRYREPTGRWVTRRTPHVLGEERECARYVEVLLPGGGAGPLTLADRAEAWLAARESRGVASVADERARLAHLIAASVPDGATAGRDVALGAVPLAELRRRHVRDAVRALTSTSGLAPRTCLHAYRTLHNLLEEAVEDDVIPANPAALRRGDRPADADVDPAWRLQATFDVGEVVSLVCDGRLHPWRRVLHALKALAGLRHGEAAALAWGSWVPAAPSGAPGEVRVVRSLESRTGAFKPPKSGVARRVPVHPALARVLGEWRAAWWRTYGRAPEGVDLVAPVPETLEPIPAGAAARWFRRDLAELGLRVAAGERRGRGGHDLRAWFKTQVVEDGADALIVRRVTNAPPRDVSAGYERFSWAATCREVAKLRVELPEGPLFAAAPGEAAEAVRRARQGSSTQQATPSSPGQ